MDDRVSHILGFDTIKQMLSECAVTRNGKAAALEIMPEYTLKRAKKLQDETKEAEHVLLGTVSHPITTYDDCTTEINRLRSGAVLSCGELIRTAKLLKTAKHAKRTLAPDDEGVLVLLPDMAEGLFFDDKLTGRIDESIINDETVADDASPELKSIRRKIRSENDLIREKLQSVMRSASQSKYLQDEIITMRNGRFVIPVKQEYKNMVKGLVHGQSSSGATLFIEPMAVVESNNRLKELEDAEKHEIERILRELSDTLRPYIRELGWNMEIMTALDIIFARASLAISMKAYPSEFDNNGVIDIRKGRHPLIDSEKVVPINLFMGAEYDSLIVTGPNTGGKTVTLKLIGLFALMAQCGMFLPAEQGSRMPLFCDVFADIGDEQSIEQSLSTFSSHMRNIIEITGTAGEGSLVLLDELGAGTDPEEGAALAAAVLEELSGRGLKLFASTHYSEIKALALKNKGFLNASMEFDVKTLSPTYKLITGVAGASNALLISSRLGLSDGIVERARSFMNKERLRFDDLMLEAEQTKRRAESELEKADRIRSEAADKIEAAKRIEEEVEKKREELLDKAREQAYEIVRDARDETERLIDELKKLASSGSVSQQQLTAQAEKTRKAIQKKKTSVEPQLKKTPAKAKTADPASLHLGDSVRVLSLGVQGTVNSLPDQKGMVGISAGIMKLNIHYTDLEPNEPQKKKPVRTSRVIAERRNVGLSINLTGYNVEDAYIELDKYLDDAFLSGRTEVYIIHGKGTGVLRNGIQQYLRRHPHIKEFRSGRYGEGEDGVTVATLK